VLEVHCAASLAELSAERERLDELNRSSRLPDPFSTFDFYETLFAHDEFYRHGVETQLWFLTFREAGQIIGYLPLRRVHERVLGLPGARLEFFATHDNDRPHLVSLPADEQRCVEAAFRYLKSRQREWSFLELRQQPPDSPLTAAHAFRPPRYLVRQFPDLDNGTIPIRWPSLREWFASLSHKMRSNTGRQFRSLAASGALTHLGSSDPAATPLLFKLYQSIEPRSWKAGADATISRSPRRLLFFQRQLDAGAPMRIRIDLLLLDGVPIAGLICGAFEQRLYALHIVFDDAFAKVGPGSAILLVGMREAIEGRYLCFNLLSGFSYYKTRWQAELVPTQSLQVAQVPGPRFLRAMLGEAVRAIVPPRPPAVDHNPTRREAAAPASAPSEHWHEVIQQLAGLGVALESNEALARSMPFDARRG
jgi:CelD/BcsL family acetyltransferase involved in cellulose biosynthesis